MTYEDSVVKASDGRVAFYRAEGQRKDGARLVLDVASLDGVTAFGPADTVLLTERLVFPAGDAERRDSTVRTAHVIPGRLGCAGMRRKGRCGPGNGATSTRPPGTSAWKEIRNFADGDSTVTRIQGADTAVYAFRGDSVTAGKSFGAVQVDLVCSRMGTGAYAVTLAGKEGGGALRLSGDLAFDRDGRGAGSLIEYTGGAAKPKVIFRSEPDGQVWVGDRLSSSISTRSCAWRGRGRYRTGGGGAPGPFSGGGGTPDPDFRGH